MKIEAISLLTTYFQLNVAAVIKPNTTNNIPIDLLFFHRDNTTVRIKKINFDGLEFDFHEIVFVAPVHTLHYLTLNMQ